MCKEETNRSKWLHIRVTPGEYKAIHQGFQKTSSLKRCEYIRNLLLGKPPIIITRDKAMDEVLEELILLRKELNSIGHNFNQAVRKLNSVSGTPEAKIWEDMLTVLRDQIEPSLGGIKKQINNYSDLWSRKLSVEQA